MKTNREQRAAHSPLNSETHLIEQLRRNTIPQYFTEEDKEILARKVRKAVNEGLKK